MKKETLTLSAKERDRLRLIHEVGRRHITGVEAARMLGISYRHFKRILSRHRREGDACLAHGMRGRRSNRRIPDDVREEIARVIRENYWDFGPTFALEQLAKRHGIRLCKESVRRIMIEGGIWKPKRKKERHRKKRERRKCFGEMLQIDGSHHDWFEGRADPAVLMVMVDDATGETRAMFAPSESTVAGMQALIGWLKEFGRPRAIYADRHAIWISQKGDKAEKDDFESTQLARALRELDMDFIAARSPQAKGRVERANGVLQDRLVKEMRLHGVSGIGEGNRFLETFLPEYNAKFRKQASSRTNAHRRLGREFDLAHIMSERTVRTVGNDYTVRWKNRIFQIDKPVRPGLRGGKVEVAVHLDGTLHLTYKGKEVVWHELELMYKSIQRHTTPRGSMGKKPSKPSVPPPDHPWRQYKQPPP